MKPEVLRGGNMYRKARWFFVASILVFGSLSPAVGRPIVGYSWEAGNSKQVSYLTADGHIHELYVVAGGDWAHADLTAITGGPPAAAGTALVGYSWAAGNSKQVSYLTADGHIHELYVVAGGDWVHADLTELTGAPPAG